MIAAALKDAEDSEEELEVLNEGTGEGAEEEEEHEQEEDEVVEWNTQSGIQWWPLFLFCWKLCFVNSIL